MSWIQGCRRCAPRPSEPSPARHGSCKKSARAAPLALSRNQAGEGSRKHATPAVPAWNAALEGVAGFFVLAEVESHALLVGMDAQAHHHVDHLQQYQAADEGKADRGQDRDELN